ncbi:MAG: hypothetical protein GC149_10680 [Gammaproteobacteria bacterium]|nr:hypothetical protein [Gammaproteobacteria bacterium]
MAAPFANARSISLPRRIISMIKQFAKLLIVASALSFAAMPAISSAKTPTCAHEAKEKGLKGKEAKEFIKECKEKRKHMKAEKKAEKKEEKK